MAEIRKILAQSSPTGGVLTDVYVVPSSTQSVISTITVCNRGTNGDNFRISIANGGASDDIKQYIYHNVFIEPHDTFATTIGITLNTTDVVRCYSDNGVLSFNLFGVELS